jgi:chromosome segregation ATPase
LSQLETTWQNTEQDYQRQIRELQSKGATELSEELKEKLTNYDDLETERDEAIREQKTLEQELTMINNQLRNKSQEAQNNQEEIARIKKAASEKDTALNKKLKELKQEIAQLKEKYSKQAQLLDEEQLEAKKLEEEIEKLQGKITSLENERQNHLANLTTYQELSQQINSLSISKITKKDLENLKELVKKAND